MPAWATIALVLGSSAIAAAAALVASWLQLRHARHEREATEQDERRRKGAAVVAPVLSLLTDAEPQRLTATPGTQTLTLMNELLERWKALVSPGSSADRVRERMLDGWSCLDSARSWCGEQGDTSGGNSRLARIRSRPQVHLSR
jgi:hypothetical protein